MKPLVLILDDDPIIAMDASYTVQEAGLNVLGPCHSVSEALALITAERPDAAVLDLNLGKETSEPVARHLKESGVPFIILSAYETRSLPEGLQHDKSLSKPFHDEQLIEAINALLELHPPISRDAAR